MTHDQVTGLIIETAIYMHRTLGPGNSAADADRPNRGRPSPPGPAGRLGRPA